MFPVHHQIFDASRYCLQASQCSINFWDCPVLFPTVSDRAHICAGQLKNTGSRCLEILHELRVPPKPVLWVQGIEGLDPGHTTRVPLARSNPTTALRGSRSMSALRSPLSSFSLPLHPPGAQTGSSSPSPAVAPTPSPAPVENSQGARVINPTGADTTAKGAIARNGSAEGLALLTPPTAAANTAFLANVQTAQVATGAVERALRDSSSALATINWLVGEGKSTLLHGRGVTSCAALVGTPPARAEGAGLLPKNGSASGSHAAVRTDASFNQAIATVLAATNAADRALSGHPQPTPSAIFGSADNAAIPAAVADSSAAGASDTISAATPRPVSVAMPVEEDGIARILEPEICALPGMLRLPQGPAQGEHNSLFPPAR